MKKLIFVASCLTILLFGGAMLFATGASEKGGAAQPVTLTFLVSNNTNLDGMKAISDYVQQKYNIATSYDLAPSGSDYDNLVKTRLATGVMDDLLNYNSGSLFQVLNPAQNFVDLTNESFMANVLDSFKAVVSDNGKVYGIPNGPSVASAWLYNKKIYAQLGLSVPKTWADLMANCAKIKAAGIVAVAGAFKDGWPAQNIVLQDYYNLQAQVPNFVNDYTANKAKYATTPAALRGWEKLAEVYQKGYFNTDLMSTTNQDCLKLVADGTAAHVPAFSVYLPYIEKNWPDKVNDIGAFPQPSDDPSISGETVWMPDAIYINAKGKNVAAAKQWVATYVSPEGVAQFISKVKPGAPFVLKGVTLPADTYPAVKDLLPYFNAGKTAPALEFISPVKGPNMPAITVEVGTGIRTALQGAQEYDLDVQKQAQQLNLPGW